MRMTAGAGHALTKVPYTICTTVALSGGLYFTRSNDVFQVEV
jgi:hypothetical protein